MKNKKIILGLPRSFDFYKLIIKNLEFHGFEVIDISYDEHNFKIKNIFDKLKHGLNKFFFNNYDYKTNLKINSSLNEILFKLNSIEDKVDYALIIRSDIYPIEIIKKIKTKTTKLIGYQWDGLHRFPAILQHIPFYDRFFVFDKNDLEKPNVKLLHNFYFDYETNIEEPIYQDFFFVGTYIKNRMPKIESIISLLDVLNMTYKVILLTSDESLVNKKIEFINQPISADEYLTHLKSSRICLDFLNNTHNGLSFRTFEALCFDKKLITNNKNIIEYDFYHPNNIFILEENNFTELNEFLKKPYIKIKEEIKLKYGFKNWIGTILNS